MNAIPAKKPRNIPEYPDVSKDHTDFATSAHSSRASSTVVLSGTEGLAEEGTSGDAGSRRCRRDEGGMSGDEGGMSGDEGGRGSRTVVGFDGGDGE